MAKIPLQNDINIDNTFPFAAQVLNFTLLLQNNKQFTLVDPLQGYGASVGVNIHEVQTAETKNTGIQCDYSLSKSINKSANNLITNQK